MSKLTDNQRHRAAVLLATSNRAAWRRALIIAKRRFRAGKLKPSGTRFKNGKDRQKHLRGFWRIVRREANEIYGNRKPPRVR